jgi:hypothetical protein
MPCFPTMAGPALRPEVTCPPRLLGLPELRAGHVMPVMPVMFVMLVMATAMIGTGVVRAEFPEPRLTAIHPPAGQRGTQVEVTLVGTDLDEVDRLEFFHPGITSAPIVPAATEFDPEPRPVAGRVRVSIAADVPPGTYDAVAIGRFGASNPRAFMVGAVPEVTKGAAIDAPDKALEVPTDGAVSGRTQAGGADYFAVMLTAGQRLRVETWARRLDSRLDGMLEVRDPSGRVVARSRRPRDEDPVVDFTAQVDGRHLIRLHDRFVRGGDDSFYRLVFSTGPVIEAVFPPVVEGGGTARLTAIGRGLPDATPSTLQDDAPGLVERPVDAQPGGTEPVPAARLVRRLWAPRDTAVALVDLHGELLDTASVPLTALVASGPVTIEQEPNDLPEQAMPIPLPAVVAGRANPRADRDWFSFEAKAGDTWIFDLFSRRLGMPTDMALIVQRVMPAPEGQPAPPPQEVAAGDDGAAEFPAFYGPASADPTLSFKAPADGTYRVLVKELAVNSVTGVDRSWALEVRRPDPGFELVAMLGRPDRADANKAVRTVPVVAIGGSTPIDVLVIRRDGFTGDVALEARGLPEGVTAAPTVVPGSANRGTLVLTAAEGVAPRASSFEIVGKAARGEAEGGEIVRTARPVTLRWDTPNANQPRVMRETRALPLAVTPETAPITVQATEQKTWETTRGGKVTVPLSVVRREGAKGGLSLAAEGLPGELKVAAVAIDEKATEATVTIDVGANLPLGTHVVLLKGVAKKAFSRNPQAVERLKADQERITVLAKERAAQAETAKQALAAAEKQVAAGQTNGQPPDPALEAAKAAARKALDEAEARAKAAEEERARREKAANDAATAAAAKDIDVPVVLAPITIVVAEKPAQEPPKQEPPKS